MAHIKPREVVFRMEGERLSFIGHIGVVMADVVREGIQDHEARMHVQSGATQSEEPVPEPEERIPDAVVARMVGELERLRTRDFAMAVLARIYGYPEALVVREVEEWEARLEGSGESRASA